MNPITPPIQWHVKVEGTPSGAVTSGKTTQPTLTQTMMTTAAITNRSILHVGISAITHT
jgi:hypothetical protein